MIDQSSLYLISSLLFFLSSLWLFISFKRDFRPDKREKTSPEIFYFLLTLITIALFISFTWNIALLISISLGIILYSLRRIAIRL